MGFSRRLASSFALAGTCALLLLVNCSDDEQSTNPTPDSGTAGDGAVGEGGAAEDGDVPPLVVCSSPLRMDTSFGQGGIASEALVGPVDPPDHVLPLADGRLLVYGFRALDRLLPTGAHDPSFNLDPKLAARLTSSSSSSDLTLCRGAIAPGNGSILACTGDEGARDGLFVYRLREDGSLDPSYGSEGVAALYLDGRDGAATTDIRAEQELVTTSDGVSYVFGALTPSGAQTGVHDAFVARLTSSGVLDPSFAGGKGYFVAGSPTKDTPALGALRPDGKLTFAMRTKFPGSGGITSVYLIRPDGTTDEAYGDAGAIELADSVLLQQLPSGDLLIQDAQYLSKRLSTGQPDVSFGDAGRVSLDDGTNDQYSAFAHFGDGSAVVLGAWDGTSSLRRFDAHGKPCGERFTLPAIPAQNAVFSSITTGPDGAIYIGFLAYEPSTEGERRTRFIFKIVQ